MKVTFTKNDKTDEIMWHIEANDEEIKGFLYQTMWSYTQCAGIPEFLFHALYSSIFLIPDLDDSQHWKEIKEQAPMFAAIIDAKREQVKQDGITMESIIEKIKKEHESNNPTKRFP